MRRYLNMFFRSTLTCSALPPKKSIYLKASIVVTLIRSTLFLSSILVFGATTECLASDAVSALAFLDEAMKALPIEELYTYHNILTNGPVHQPRRNIETQPTAQEFALPADGWKLKIQGNVATVLFHAAKDFQDYLSVSMDTRVVLEQIASLADWKELTGVIVAGTREQLPGCGETLQGPKDYEIIVTPERIVVCGFDERGVMFGLFNLEARMNLREAPILPCELDAVRHSLYRARIVQSWLGWDEYPDALLSHMSHDGIDAIFASVYANPNGAETPWPYSEVTRRQDPAKMRDMIQRAARFGIQVYAPIMFDNTGTPENEQALRKLVRDNVQMFPEIRGYVLLTEGFMYKGFTASGSEEALREWAKSWGRAVGIVTEEAHRIDPKIEILTWEYNIDFRPTGAAVKRFAVTAMPKDSIPLVTWENGKSFELGPYRGFLRDYSLSEVGPSEVAEAQIDEARKLGKPVYAKADTFATWQYGTMPYLPCPQQWFRRYDALASCRIDGTMETWSTGYKPNFMSELRAWTCWSDAPPRDELLRAVARREFGPGSEDKVLKAWDHFSQGIELVPDTWPNMGTNNAVAAPLFFSQPVQRGLTINHSFAKGFQHLGGYSPDSRWPYTIPRLLFFPDFSNQTNQAEQYARDGSGVAELPQDKPLEEVLPFFNSYLLRAADEFEAGLVTYRQAALAAPPAKRVSALKEVLIAEQLQRMMRSEQAILEFEDLRFKLMNVEDTEKKRTLLDRMAEILRQELERTKASAETARRDSRLGYQMEQDYVYYPAAFEAKMKLLKHTLENELPAYRAQHNIP